MPTYHIWYSDCDCIQINFDCFLQGIDAMDTSGETHIDIVHNIYKRRLDLEGQPIEDPQREQGVGETKKIINGTRPAATIGEQVKTQFSMS